MAHRWERYAGSGLAGGAQDLPLAIGLTCEAETPEAEEIAEVGGGEGVAGHQGFTKGAPQPSQPSPRRAVTFDGRPQ